MIQGTGMRWSITFAMILCVVLLTIACRPRSLTETPTTPGPVTPFPTLSAPATATPAERGKSPILWSAEFETGDFSQLLGDDGGAIVNTGTGVASITSDIVHSGRYAAKLTISGASGSKQAVRLFRWDEPHDNRGAYYSAWY